METYEVAHLREQGEDIVMVLVAPRFGHLGNRVQNAVRVRLQTASRSAGLAGTVVPVWDAGGGRMGYMAPPQWRSFFNSLSLYDVAANVNRTLTVY